MLEIKTLIGGPLDGELKKDDTGDANVYELVIVKPISAKMIYLDNEPMSYFEESFERVRYNSYRTEFFDEPIKFWVYYKIDPIMAIKDFVLGRLTSCG